MDETLAARWSKREELIRLVESGVNIRLRQAKDFHFLARFLFSQICVKVNGKLPFLDLVLRLSVFHNTKDGWVTAGTAMDGTRKKMITIDFEPIIWMLLRINEPEMRDMLVSGSMWERDRITIDKMVQEGDLRGDKADATLSLIIALHQNFIYEASLCRDGFDPEEHQEKFNQLFEYLLDAGR